MSNEPAIAAASEAHPTQLAAMLCSQLGEGYSAHDAPQAGVCWINGPDGSRVELRLNGADWECRALAWPSVEGQGLRRRFQQDIHARVAVRRGVDVAAHELRRRVFAPYGRALQDARTQARIYREALRDLRSALGRSGFRDQDAQLVGRSLRLGRPYTPLDTGAAMLPSASTTTVVMHDLAPVVQVDLHNLTPDEAASVHAFVDQLMTRRSPQLRLCA